MKIILGLWGCFLLAFRWGAITRAGPRWLETWFPLLLYRSFLPEPVLAFCQPGRWVTSPHLVSRLEASRFPWTAALMLLAVLVPDWQRETSPTCLRRIFFSACFAQHLEYWHDALKSPQKKSVLFVQGIRRGYFTLLYCLDEARNYEWFQSDSFLPYLC